MHTKDILTHYDIGTVESVVPVGTGLINTTYRVVTEGGDFVLQKIHKVIPDAAAGDMQVVTAFLAMRGMKVPTLMTTRDGGLFVRDAAGDRWRVYPWIAGTIVDALASPDMARSAGRIVGEMHRHLAELDYTPKGSIPHFHDTAFFVDELRSIADDLPDEAKAIADDILATLPPLIIGDDAGRKQVSHADLKISNIVFDADGAAVGVIDFDTILWHYPAVDLGDAFRSWCNPTAEDDPDATFDAALFAAAEAGYAEGRGVAASPEDRVLHLRATKQIALELASRFLIDIVRDNYFGFDASRYPDRKSHNLARAKGQHHLASTIPTA